MTDIGWVFSYLEGAKMPLSQVTAYTPFSTNNVPVQLDTMRELFNTVPEFKKEWEQYNLVSSAPPVPTATTSIPRSR